MTEDFGVKLAGLLIALSFAFPTLVSLIKGAPFVPTPFRRVEAMLKYAGIRKGMRLYDLGCGDGRFVYLAANRYSADAVGFEYSPAVYVWARIRKFFWGSRARVVFADFWKQNIADADIVVCYLLPGVVERVAEKIERECREGTKVLSYAFRIKRWKEVKKIERVAEKNFSPIWVYAVKKGKAQ